MLKIGILTETGSDKITTYLIDNFLEKKEKYLLNIFVITPDELFTTEFDCLFWDINVKTNIKLASLLQDMNQNKRFCIVGLINSFSFQKSNPENFINNIFNFPLKNRLVVMNFL